MAESIFQGGLVRLLDNDPARPVSARITRGRFEGELDPDNLDGFYFIIHKLDADQRIGFVGLGGISWNHGEAWVGIGLGERAYWGKGYGTDAMRVILRYAFTELNLHRVSLGVFEYNPRAIRSYEKVGFVSEGRSRKQVGREGKRWDEVHMGIRRDEWIMMENGEGR
jgi:RimJ/RimL family protein N-acetyltransferase